jgi:hypothetical protein
LSATTAGSESVVGCRLTKRLLYVISRLMPSWNHGGDQPAVAGEEPASASPNLANGEIVVTLTDTSDLNTVHDLCQLIADACLDGDDDIDFTRDPTEANTRLEDLR